MLTLKQGRLVHFYPAIEKPAAFLRPQFTRPGGEMVRKYRGIVNLLRMSIVGRDNHCSIEKNQSQEEFALC